MVDVRFGSNCPREPIKVADISSYKSHRLIKEGKEYKLQFPAEGDFSVLYRFDLENSSSEVVSTLKKLPDIMNDSLLFKYKKEK